MEEVNERKQRERCDAVKCMKSEKIKRLKNGTSVKPKEKRLLGCAVAPLRRCAVAPVEVASTTGKHVS